MFILTQLNPGIKYILHLCIILHNIEPLSYTNVCILYSSPADNKRLIWAHSPVLAGAGRAAMLPAG